MLIYSVKAEKEFEWIFFRSTDCNENPKQKVHSETRPKKICDRFLDPKKYRACKFSTQKNTSEPPPPPIMYTSNTPPGTNLTYDTTAYTLNTTQLVQTHKMSGTC